MQSSPKGNNLESFNRLINYHLTSFKNTYRLNITTMDFTHK